MTSHPTSDAAPPTSTSRNRSLAICAAIVAVILVLDQLTKSLVRARLEVGDTWPEGWELIRVAHVTNSGAAFGLFSDATTLLTIGTMIASVIIVVLIVMFAGRHQWYALGLSLILGGAAGNLIDRVRLGAVTDFIDPISYPAFNLADSAIVIGVAGLLIFTLFDRDEDPATGDGPERAEDSEGTPLRAQEQAER